MGFDMSNEMARAMYSIVIPCYKSGAWLDELVTRLNDGLAERARSSEIILINDASPDEGGTRDAIKALAHERENVIGINLLYNTGQHRAILCGLNEARGKYTVVLDDDLQTPPEEVSEILDCIESDSDIDVVYGNYSKKQKFYRRIGASLVAAIFSSQALTPKGFTVTSFFAFTSAVRDAVISYRTSEPNLGIMIMKSTSRIETFEATHLPRKYGKSGYSLRKLISDTFFLKVSLTERPMRGFSVLGMIVISLSLIYSAYEINKYFTHGTTVPGFTTTVMLITFFGGITILGIGIMGEYLGRSLRESAPRPHYVIRERFERVQNREK